MASRRRVLLVYSHWSRFVHQDHDILSGRFDVERFQLRWHARLRDRWRETHRALRRAIRRNDIVYWWFLSDYAATGATLARLYRKRFIGVAGGWDVAAEPEVDYGRLVGSRRARRATQRALRQADTVLAVSPLNRDEAQRAARVRRVVLVPNGVDVDHFRPDPRHASSTTERPLVVAVGGVNASNLHVKGQETFAKLSKAVPEADFQLIGSAAPDIAEHLRALGGPNLEITGFIPDDELLRRLQRARVVCQLSWHESFGMGLVEAVACGAAPVHSQTRIGAAPYLDDLAHTAPYGDVDAAAEAVRKALDASAEPGYRDRAHAVIRRRIPLEHRAERLLVILSEG